MSKPLRSTLRGLVSLIAVVLLLAGPPLALIRFVGNPLPSSVPTMSELTDSLTQHGVPDEVVINTLAILAWVTWAQLAVAIAVEIAAQFRHRPSPQLPAIPGFQPLAGHLVAGVLLIGTLLQPTRNQEPQPPLTFERTEKIALVDEAPSETEPDPVAAPTHSPAEPTSTYVVERHDSLWSIAENTLGDGMRWRQIRDMNIGRAQPDGQSLTANSDVIHPGWTLLVPAPAEAASSASSTYQVQPGDHLWKIAKHTLRAQLGRQPTDSEIDPYWREIIETNRASLPTPADPNLIFPGQEVRLPPPPGHQTQPSPAPAPEPTQPTEPTHQAEAEATAQPPPPAEPDNARPRASIDKVPEEPRTQAAPERHLDDAHQDGSPSGADKSEQTTGVVVPGLLGIAGAGVACAVGLQLHRRRRNRQARAAPGAVVPSIPNELRDLHRSVMTTGDPESRADLRSALFETARHGAEHRHVRCRPRLIQLAPDRIEVLLATPEVEVPEGWTAEQSGQVWSRPRSRQPLEPPDCPTPLLVTVGRPEKGTEILYDLETAGLTVASGHAELVSDTIRSLLHELVHGPAEVHVVTVGDVPTVEHDRVLHAQDWDDIAKHALGWATISADALKAHKFDSAFTARGSGRSIDGLVPLLVVCNPIPNDDRFHRLVELAGSTAAGILAVSQHPVGAGTDLIITEDGAAIPRLGLEFQPQHLDSDVADQVDQLIECADRPADERPSQPPTLARSATDGDVSDNGRPYTDPPYDVLVRVLGSIDVEGGGKPLSPKQLGLLAYIVTHPGCTVDKVETSVWPEGSNNPRHRVHNTLWALRSILGADQVLTFDEVDGYRVADTVRTDRDLFERRVTYAADRRPAESIRILRGALDLVTGQPFTYTSTQQRSLTWVDHEDWAYRTESLVVDGAHQMAQLCSEHGDPDAAIWAIRKGLLASPTNTELTNSLMQIHIAAGEPTAAKRVFVDHERALESLDLGEPEESTLEIWEQLETKRSNRR